MGISSSLSKRAIALLSVIIFGVNTGYTQGNGIIPLSGLKYFSEGISFKSIEVKVNGMALLNNRLPISKEIEIYINQAGGFVQDGKQMIYAGAEVSILSPKGEQLAMVPNIFQNNLTTGFNQNSFKSPVLKFMLTPQILKTNTQATIKIRLYDLKGKNQLKLELPVTVARPGEAMFISKTTRLLKSPPSSVAMVNELKASNTQVAIDTTIKTAPKMAYLALDILNIDGAGFTGILDGKESFTVYDKNLNEHKISDMLLKEVRGSLEGSKVNYKLKIPFALKTAPSKGYIVRFRWESTDRIQVIDIVTNL